MQRDDRHRHYQKIAIQTRQSLEDAKAVDDALLAYLLGMVLELISDAGHRARPVADAPEKAAG